MRVLAVTHSLGANGAAWCLCRVLVAIKAAGGTADVLYSGNELLAQYLRDHGVGILEQAQASDYDVAVVNTLIDHQRVLQLAPVMPVLFWVHEGSSTVQNGLAQAPGWMQAFRQSSRLVFDTAWQAESVFKSFLEGVPAHRILQVAPAGNSAAQTDVGPRPAEGGRRIVALGSVYPRKRPFDLVQAVMRMGDALAHCTLVGNLDHVQLNGQAMLDTIAQNPQRFTLAGEVTDAQKQQHLQQSDVFCSASGDETFGMAQMEAAALGLPLALSDLPCYAGIWQHGVNALLSPVGAVDCLSWNLVALTQDAALAARLGQAAQATAARFGTERFLRQMSDALVQTIQDPLPRPVSNPS
jgi:glycosyltransferase involved in cell wall biosynthesis